MGAFLLLHGASGENPVAKDKLNKALELFREKKKLPEQGSFQLGEYTLYLFGKRFYPKQNYLKKDQGDFIASTGSLYYHGKSGQAALEDFYTDYTKLGETCIQNCKGHYCIILYHSGTLLLFRDYYGIYPVYKGDSNKIVSSSFLAVSLLSDTLTIAKDELYEYLFNGYWYGLQTLFQELTLLESRGILNLSDQKYKGYTFDFAGLKNKNYSLILQETSQNLKDHFGNLVSAFENIRTGLSGGYDSRLVLAGLQSRQYKPDLFVNGTPGSKDIRCAQSIAEGLDIPIEEIRFYEEYAVTDDAIEDFLMNRFYLFDGLGSGGIFNNYSDIEFKLNHPVTGKAHLNGAGGEIYRESWNLPNHPFTLDAFIRARYDTLPFDELLHGYSRKEYLRNITRKTRLNLGKNKKVIRRSDIELLHPARYKAIHFIMSTMQELYPFILPFYEPFLIRKSMDIPMRFKYYGRFNKDLIRSLQPGLTSYMSTYGYTFDQKVPIRIHMQEFLKTNTPLILRPYLRKFKKSRLLPVKELGRNLLDPVNIRKALPDDNWLVTKYIKVEKLKPYDGLRSRVMTVEVLFRTLGIR